MKKILGCGGIVLLCAQLSHAGPYSLFMDVYDGGGPKQGLSALAPGAGEGIPAVEAGAVSLSQSEKEKLNGELLKEASRGNKDEVKMLLAAGAEAWAKTGLGETALQLASKRGHLEIMRMLLAAGAFVNSKDDFGKTALIAAATANKDEAVKLLLDVKGIEIDIADSDNFTALMWAARQGYEKIALLLLEKGSKIDFQAAASELTPLMAAVHHQKTSMVKLLISKGADLNIRGPLGDTARGIAKRHGYEEISTVLIAAGAKL